MKKRATSVKKSAVKKATRRTSRSHSDHILLVPVSFQRIILVTSCLLLFIVAVVAFNKDKVTQSVAGVSIARGLFSQATVVLPKVEGGVSYNVYYKKSDVHEFSNAARAIPASSSSYTISYLKKGEEYQYKVAALDKNGEEFWWSPVTPLTNLESM